MKTRPYYISMIVSALLFSGCFSATPSTMQKHSKDVSDEDVTALTDSALAKNIKEIHRNKECIDISVQKTLKTILDELQVIDGSIYILEKNTKNIDIPVNSKFKISSFWDLVTFLTLTTDYTLVINENRYRKDLPKIVEVVHKDSVKNNISKHSVPIKIRSSNGAMTAKDALVSIAQEIKFSIVFKHVDFPEVKTLRKNSSMGMQNPSEGLSAVATIFDNAIINFYGDSLSDFFNYIESSFDVFIDVDYDKKQILISKLKTNVLKLAMPNIELTSQNNGSSAVEGGTDGVNGTLIESKIAISLYAQLQEKLEKVFSGTAGTTQFGGTGSGGQTQQEYFDIDTNNGEVLVVAGKEKLERAREAIDSFNEAYSKIIYADFRVYEVLVFADNKFGTGIQGAKEGFSLNANQEVVGFMAYAAKITDSLSIETTLESLHTYGHILKGYKASARLIDNIPKSIQLTTADDYVSKITNNVTTSTGTINTETSNEISTLNYGKTITLKPKSHDDFCVVEIDYESSGKPNLKDRVIGTNTIQISENKTKDKYRDIVKLKSKETVIVNVIEEFVSANDYKGVLPIENFIIGGSKKDQYLKKEIIFLLSLQQMDSNQ
ncbi:MAG: hypothetical protein PHE67_04125 [Campylobacterales bacterium]|nr:hypothetical protein [Campylobacterales bacterium]